MIGGSLVALTVLLGREALAHPYAVLAAVSQAVVEPVRPPLPELYLDGRDAVAAPIFGPRHGAGGVADFELVRSRFEHLARGNRRALIGGNSADLAPVGPRCEVGIRLVGRDPRDRALDAHLALERR